MLCFQATKHCRVGYTSSHAVTTRFLAHFTRTHSQGLLCLLRFLLRPVCSTSDNLAPPGYQKGHRIGASLSADSTVNTGNTGQDPRRHPVLWNRPPSSWIARTRHDSRPFTSRPFRYCFDAPVTGRFQIAFLRSLV